jgi:hypothetical protein
MCVHTLHATMVVVGVKENDVTSRQVVSMVEIRIVSKILSVCIAYLDQLYVL